MTRKQYALLAGIVLVASAMVYAAVEVARAPRWTVDDAYIVARYADHLVHRGVLAYNLEGPRVEGFTSPLFALIATIASALGVAPVPAMTAVGIASYVMSGPLVFGLARALRLPRVAAGVATWVYLAIPEHVTHARSGLETEAFLAVELACAWAFARAWVLPRGRAPLVLVGACCLASVIRPEGFAVAAVLVGLLAYRVAKLPRERARFGRAVALGLALPLGVLVAARLLYFHALLPNTFFAKGRGALAATVLREAGTLVENYLFDFAVTGLAVIVIARLLGAPRGRVAPRTIAVAAAALGIFAAFMPAYAHKDVMNFSRRFAMHTLPWLFTSVLLVVAHASSRLARLRRRRGAIASWVILAGATPFVAALWLPAWSLQREAERDDMSAHVLSRRRVYDPAVRLLQQRFDEAAAEHPEGGPKLAVYPDGGYLSYRTDLFTLDFGRLNDRYLAREAQTSDDVVRYFFANAPDAVAFSNYGTGRLWNAAATSIVQDPRFSQYELARQWLDGRGWGLSIYVRRR